MSTWISVAFPTSAHTRCAFPQGIDKDNYIAINYGRNESISVQKYNMDDNEWKQICERNDIQISHTDTVTLDTNKQIISIFGTRHRSVRGTLTQIDLINGKVSRNELNETFAMPYFPICFPRNNSLFAVGWLFIDSLFAVGAGVFNPKISVKEFNAETKTVKEFATIAVWECGLVYQRQTDRLLLFGGESNDISEFDMKQKKLYSLKVSLPKKISLPFCTLAIRNRYVFIFGGSIVGNCGEYSDEIYIYCLKTKTLTKSSVKCHAKTLFEGITVSDESKDEKAVFGYVRYQWKVCEIDDHCFPPFYLLKLMHSYFLNEFVYLLDKGNQTHYKMNTVDILQ